MKNKMITIIAVLVLGCTLLVGCGNNVKDLQPVQESETNSDVAELTLNDTQKEETPKYSESMTAALESELVKEYVKEHGDIVNINDDTQSDGSRIEFADGSIYWVDVDRLDVAKDSKFDYNREKEIEIIDGGGNLSGYIYYNDLTLDEIANLFNLQVETVNANMTLADWCGKIELSLDGIRYYENSVRVLNQYNYMKGKINVVPTYYDEIDVYEYIEYPDTEYVTRKLVVPVDYVAYEKVGYAPYSANAKENWIIYEIQYDGKTGYFIDADEFPVLSPAE